MKLKINGRAQALLSTLLLSACFACSAVKAQVAPTITDPTQILANAPQASSFTNATFEIDFGAATLGIGTDTSAFSFIRAQGNWNTHCYTSLETQIGAGSLIQAVVIHPLGLRKAFDNYEFYAGVGPEWSFINRTCEIEGGLGGKWTPSTNGILANFSVGGEIRTVINWQTVSTQQPGLGLLGFITYKF